MQHVLKSARGAADVEVVAAELSLQFDIAMDDADAALHAGLDGKDFRRLLVTSKGRLVGEVVRVTGHGTLHRVVRRGLLAQRRRGATVSQIDSMQMPVQPFGGQRFV